MPASRSSSDFNEGVLWGMFLANLNRDDEADADARRERALTAAVDQIDKTPYAAMHDLRSVIVDAWDHDA
jgi:hypothetical protein